MQSFLGTGTLLVEEPATAKNRPVGMMLPEIVRTINSLAQRQPGQFSKLSAMQARTIGELGQYGELTMIPRRDRLNSSHDWVYNRGATGSDIYKKISAEIARREKFLIHDFSAPELKKIPRAAATNCRECRRDASEV